jgi:malate synthase
VAIFNLMEDAATAEISRTQLWQWTHHPAAFLDDGRKITKELYLTLADEEQAKLEAASTADYRRAREIIDFLITSDEYYEFLTTTAYSYLDE